MACPSTRSIAVIRREPRSGQVVNNSVDPPHEREIVVVVGHKLLLRPRHSHGPVSKARAA
jgi:hypothetical protein